MTENLATKTIAELAPMIESKEISPVDISKSLLSRIEKYDGEINSYIEVTAEEQLLEKASKIEKEIMDGQYKGPLHGIPVALKDIFYIKGEKTTFGSKIHQNFIADQDATVIEKLKDSGAFLTGKLTMHEYAAGGTNSNEHYGYCRNPWDLSRIPGGSSGGSGAAVSADLTIASLGTDTGGSIRIPAAACGIVGLKPTHGLVSKFGCFPLAWSLDHIGPMTKSVTDAAIMLQQIVGQDKRDATSIIAPLVDYAASLTGDIAGKVIGIEEDFFFSDVDPDVEVAVKDAIKKLESLGAKVETVKIPSLKYANYAEYMTFLAEAALIHKKNMRLCPEDFGPSVRSTLLVGSLVETDHYLEAQQMRRLMALDFEQVWKQVDVLIAPTLPTIAYPIGDSTVTINGKDIPSNFSFIRYNIPANLLGLPSIALPIGLSNGMPISLQIMGPALSEATILNMAYAFEQVNPLAGMKPNLDAVFAQ